ncbi:LytR/AlgR family response regulator transcription factor [Ferruginibacter sp.]
MQSKPGHTINCLIVDDEPIARQIIETYCNHLSMLHVLGSCANALEAKAILQSSQVDILFLDVNMPVLDGVAFLKTLKNPPQVIFTTAYKEYATDAFDLSACDYLLKPFSLERFIIAVDKALEKLQVNNGVAPANADLINDSYVFIKADGKIYKVFFTDILFAEANGNYTKIVTAQSQLLTSMTFTAVEELLPRSLFFRIHRSFIINKSSISYIEGNVVLIGKKEIPIGSNYKNDFLNEIGI